ncbi:MAG: EAL domain-containing protein, partial [Pseudomonadota bacterium]
DALETSAFDVPVGRFVIERACEQASRWQRAGVPVRVGVNVSAGQLYGDDLADVLSIAMARHETPAELIEVEITERVALGDLERVSALLDALRALGVSVAADDFGTGFASLSSLMRFPFDRVKIDRSFVSGIGYDEQSARLTASLVRMCHGLGFQVTAEGIEEASHEAFLQLHGCDEVQGYHYSKPVPAAAATDLLMQRPKPRRQEPKEVHPVALAG